MVVLDHWIDRLMENIMDGQVVEMDGATRIIKKLEEANE